MINSLKEFHCISLIYRPDQGLLSGLQGRKSHFYYLMAVCTRYTDDMKERVPSHGWGGQQRCHMEETLIGVLKDELRLARQNRVRKGQSSIDSLGTGNTTGAGTEKVTQIGKTRSEIKRKPGPDCERSTHQTSVCT